MQLRRSDFVRMAAACTTAVLFRPAWSADPPRNAVINIPLSESLKAAFASPNDRPAEAYEDR